MRHGKGARERLAPLAGGAARAVVDWLALRGAAAGGLFRPVTPTGRIQGAQLSSNAVYKVLRKRLGQAGVAKRSPHDFRRTFVGNLPDAGIALATVQQLAGHASVTTTARHDRRGEAATRQAVDVLHCPYRSRQGGGR